MGRVQGTITPPRGAGGRVEKGRTRQCAMSEERRGRATRRRTTREGGTGERRRAPRRRDGGEEEREGVRRGELPATRSPSIPRLTLKPPIRAFGVTLARYSLAASFFPSFLSLSRLPATPAPRRVAPLRPPPAPASSPITARRVCTCIHYDEYAHVLTRARAHGCPCVS